jgi:hypothetical protein
MSLFERGVFRAHCVVISEYVDSVEHKVLNTLVYVCTLQYTYIV